MPPEVLIGYTETTAKIDIWALGIMLHAMITGYFPFRSSNKDELKRQIREKEISINRKEIPISDNCLDLI
jgi:serine/threonine protein kinase